MSRIRLAIMAIIACLATGESVAQVPQVCTLEKLAALRASLPATEGDKWQAVFRSEKTQFYSDAEIPAAYQHADGGLINNGSFTPVNGRTMATTFHSPRYNISGDAREAAKGQGMGGNANIEFPWRTPGGTDFSEGASNTFKFMRLPDRGGGVWPVVWYRMTMDDNRIGPHTVYAWVFPVGTVFGEVLALRDSKGAMHTYEVRLRIREATYWDIEILRPFPREADLAMLLVDKGQNFTAMRAAPVVSKRLTDTLHRRVGFDVAAETVTLPKLGEDLAAELLDSTPFKSAVGAAWRGDKAFAPTSSEPFSIVPANYHGTFLGTDTDSCKRCHEHTLKHVDHFDNQRNWYGRVRGSDQIFTWHPIDPGSVSYAGGAQQVQFRESFVRAGIIEAYDQSKHPADRYTVLK